MATTRKALEKITNNIQESMGVRQHDARPQLSPVPNAKDVGRRPLRKFATIEISQIIPDPAQPRKEFPDEQIEQLAQSIRDKGQLTPIKVRWLPTHGKWIIIFGERRYRAALRAGLQSIECQCFEGELTESEILEEQLIENMQRENLKPVEEAEGFDQLLKLNNWTAKELSKAIRFSEGKIARSLALLKLPEDIQQRVDQGQISARAAYEASKLDSPEQQRAAIEQSESAADRITIATVHKRVRQRQGKKARPSRGTKQTFSTEGGWKIIISAPHKGTYFEMKEALQEIQDEVQLRIDNNVQLDR